MARIFVSYGRADRQFIDSVVPLLRRMYGQDSVWFDDEIHGGADWWQVILDEIADCDLFIYLISNNSLASLYCQAELREAQRLQKQFLPVIVRPKTRYPGTLPLDLIPLLRQTQFVDLTVGITDTTALTKLYASVNRLLNAVSPHQLSPLASLPTRQPPVPDKKSKRQLTHPWATVVAATITGLFALIATLIAIPTLRNSDHGGVEPTQTSADVRLAETLTPTVQSSQPTLSNYQTDTPISTEVSEITHATPSIDPSNITDLEEVKTIDDEACRGVESLAFSPDGEMLAGGGHLRICLWDVATGNTIQTLDEINAPARSLAFSPDGTILASGSDEGVLLWDTESGTLLSTLFDQSVNSVAFSPDGTMLVAGGVDIRLWSVATGNSLSVLDAPQGGLCTSSSIDVLSVAFDPNGIMLAASTDLGALQLWDVSSWDVLYEGTVARGCDTRLVFDPSGKWLASGTHASTVGEDVIQLWAVEANGHLREMHRVSPLNAWGYFLAFDPSGTMLASGTEAYDGGVQLWEVQSGTELWMVNNHNWIRSVTFSSRSLLAVGDNDAIYLLTIEP